MKKITIIMAIMLLTISFVSATNWEQYTPTPTTNDIKVVRSLSNGYSFAVTSGGTNYLIYNGSWNEINSPSSSLITNFTFVSIDKDGIGNLYLVYKGNFGTPELYKMRTLKYDFLNNNFSLVSTTDKSSSYSYLTFDCEENSKECFGVYGNQIGLDMIMRTFPSYVNETTGSGVGYVTELSHSNEEIMINYRVLGGGGLYLYEWNGISKILRYSEPFRFATLKAHYKVNSDNRFACYTNPSNPFYGGVYSFNQSSGLFYPSYNFAFDDQHYCYDLTYIDGKAHFITNQSLQIRSVEHGSNESNKLLVSSHVLNSLDYDENSGMGWAVGEGGYIYLYNGTGTGFYSVTSDVESNPTAYGTDTNFYATPSHPEGEKSNIEVIFYNSTDDDVYTWNWLNVPSGSRVENLVDELAWLSLPVDNYTIKMTATSQITGDSSQDTFNWRVVESVNETSIIYELEEYSYSNENITDINTLTNYGNDISYFTGLNDTDILIISLDHSNLNDLTLDIKALAEDNKTAYIDKFTSIDASTNNLYIGSDDELYDYAIGNSGTAESLSFTDSISMTGRDYVTSVASVDDSYAWICQKGYLSDDARLYNVTSADLTTALGENPCLSAEYDSTNDLLFIHKGASVEIYNQTNQTLISSISTSSVSEEATDDLITINGNYIYIITAYNTLKKYDVSNPSTPTLIDECRADRNIISVEAISENQTIIGTPSTIGICDFANGDNYYAGGGYYIVETLKSLSTGEKAVQIVKNTNNKFSVALTNGIKIFTYERRTETVLTNQAPTIEDVSSSDTTPCLEQVVYIDITANDNEGDDITYDWSCNAFDKPSMTNNYLFNTFSCTYYETGFKNIIVYATDGYNTAVKDTITVNVQNCTAPNILSFKVLNYNTNEEIENVLVTLSDGQTQNTDSNGNVEFTVAQDADYTVTFEKEGYFTISGTQSPSNSRTIVLLKPTTDETGEPITSLTVYTLNENGSAISNSLVSLTNTYTGVNDFGITASDGKVVLTNVPTGNKLLLSATNEEGEYQTKQIYISLSDGEQKTVTLTLSYEDVREGVFSVSGRQCSDFISGVWLCGNLTISGIGNNCSSDSDCISAKCGYGHGNSRECSRFNYTLCDDQEMGRGNMCIIKNSVFGSSSGSIAIFKTYFISILVLIIIVITVLILTSIRRK